MSRHAEGLHNVVGEVDPSAYLLEENEDASLSQNGVLQCLKFAAIEQELKISSNSTLLIVSPHRRTLQTATYSFPHLIFQIPWIASEDIRERTGLHPCDRRRPISEQLRHYPHIDFSELIEDEDNLYPLYTLKREPSSSVTKRGLAFLDHVSKRPEKEIIVVTHSAFLEHFLETVVDMHEEKPIVRFRNCEMRSYVVDFNSKKAIKLNSSNQNNSS